MRPTLYRDYREAMYIKSCIDFCQYMVETAEQNESAEQLEHWSAKRGLFQTDMALGLLTATRDYEIEALIEQDANWQKFIQRGPVQKQAWELEEVEF